MTVWLAFNIWWFTREPPSHHIGAARRRMITFLKP
jgi:hypothetical protein